MDISGFPNYTIDKYGVVTNKTTGNTIKPIMSNNYFQVRLNRNGKQHTKTVHILVYEAWKGKRTKGMHIDHIDCIRTNNHIDNLREVTPEENNRNRKHIARGSDVNTSKLTEEQVMQIRKLKSEGANSNELSKKYGVTKGAINRIARGNTWKHLPLLPVDNSIWSNPKVTGAMSGRKLRDKYGEDYFKRVNLGQKIKRHCETCTCPKPPMQQDSSSWS